MLNCRFTCFFVKEDPASHCVDHRLRLLKDLLLHERFKVACTEEACAQMRSQAGKYKQSWTCPVFTFGHQRASKSTKRDTWILAACPKTMIIINPVHNVSCCRPTFFIPPSVLSGKNDKQQRIGMSFWWLTDVFTQVGSGTTCWVD